MQIEVTIAVPWGDSPASARDQQTVCHETEQAVKTVFPAALYVRHEISEEVAA